MARRHPAAGGHDLRGEGASVQRETLPFGPYAPLDAQCFLRFQRVDLLSSPQLVQNEPERRRMEAQGVEVKEAM